MNLKSRKLIILTVLFVTSVLFVVLERADFTQWADFMKWAFAVYAASNVGEHYTRRMQK